MTISAVVPCQVRASTAKGLAALLEAAVIANWDDLMPYPQGGSIHIEYGTGTDGAVDYLKVLSSATWGYWNLVCEYWTRSRWGHLPGMSFGDIPCPPGFAQAISKLMQHQPDFGSVCELPSNGMLQIYMPTVEERKQALICLTEAFDCLRLGPSELSSAGKC